MLIVLQIIAVLNVGLTSFYALVALSNPKTLAPGRTTPGMRTLVYFGAMRTFALGAATIGAIVLGAREGFLWLAGVGAAVILFDSLPGQVTRDPKRTLIPLGIGAVQAVLLAIVVSDMLRETP
jgi:hypothetical protein